MSYCYDTFACVVSERFSLVWRYISSVKKGTCYKIATRYFKLYLNFSKNINSSLKITIYYHSFTIISIIFCNYFKIVCILLFICKFECYVYLGNLSDDFQLNQDSVDMMTWVSLFYSLLLHSCWTGKLFVFPLILVSENGIKN